MRTFIFNDGGRAAAGFKGTTGDCVVRAIAIATETPYQHVYDTLHAAMRAAHRKKHRGSPRNGVPRRIICRYMERLGWRWTACMTIGSGCTVHLVPSELPGGKIIASLSAHLVAVVDGVVHDIYDPARGGTRCVYGYWSNA
jgi:hypothetical protein